MKAGAFYVVGIMEATDQLLRGGLRLYTPPATSFSTPHSARVMINSYFTLRALVNHWHDDLVGCRVHDAFSQVKNEFSLALTGAESDWMLRSSVQRPLLFLFRTEGISKKKRNVATLFRGARGRVITDVRIAHLDRMVMLDLNDDSRLVWQLFGARANVFWVDAQGLIQDAFRNADRLVGSEAPTPRAAPMPDTLDDFLGRWRPNRNKTRQAIQSAVPLFGRLLARETVYRADLDPTADPETVSDQEKEALYTSAQTVLSDLQTPAPRLYGHGPFPDAFSLIPLQHRSDEREGFCDVDEGVRVSVRRMLAKQHFDRLYDPLDDALTRAAERAQRTTNKMMDELASESRADRYEQWAHLLMTQPDVEPGAEEVMLPNMFSEDDETVTIPLDPAKSLVENAEYYYDRARRTRRSREEAEARLDDAIARAESAQQLLDDLHAIDTLDGIKRFRKQRTDALAPFLDSGSADLDTFPFRRFDLGGGFEVWVGKNARQNDELTFHTAQKYDIWMHARQVPGSHTVLHLPNRDADPGRKRLVQAAQIAAYYSKARGSGAVPVMYTRRKYVRSPKGSAPGAVTVQREEVLMVEPGLPG